MSAEQRHAGYLVECYWPHAGIDTVAAAVTRARQATRDLREQGHRLHYLGAIFVPSDRTGFCLFDGDEASVRAATEQAGLPYERVLASLHIDGADPDDTGETDTRGLRQADGDAPGGGE